MYPSSDIPEQTHRDRSVFVALLGLYFLVLYPILRANRYCNDDLKRALFGRTGWDSNGRPLTSFLMKLLQCYNHALVDISPLTQIGAIAILAWVGVLIARRYVIRSYWMAALLAFPLGGQPFYLENLSYKFDALSMSLAMLLALLPILTFKDDRKGWWLGILALFGSLGLYQSAINVYLIFIVLDVVLGKLQDMPPRQLMMQFLSRALQASLGMLIYQLVIGIHIGGWVKQKSVAIHSLGELGLIKTNVVDFYRFIADSFNTHWWMYIAPLLILLAFFPVAIGIRYAIRARLTQPSWVSAVLFANSLLVPLAALACVLGPMLVLANPPIFPRLLMGVGALLTAALIVMHAALQQVQQSEKLAMSVACVLAIGMCSIASVYGNAAGEQKNYENRIAARLADDLGELKANQPIDYYLVDGTAGYSPVTAHVAGQFPIINSLVPSFIDGHNLFFTHLFFSYYITDIADLRHKADAETALRIAAILAKTCQIPVARNTSAYSLRLIDNVALVTFHFGHPQRCMVSAHVEPGDASIPAPEPKP